MWQDFAITGIIWLFVIFTIPMVRQVFRDKISLTPITTVPTFVGNYALAVIWVTFPEPLWISFFSSLCIASLWLLMALGSLWNKKK